MNSGQHSELTAPAPGSQAEVGRSCQGRRCPVIGTGAVARSRGSQPRRPWGEKASTVSLPSSNLPPGLPSGTEPGAAREGPPPQLQAAWGVGLEGQTESIPPSLRRKPRSPGDPPSPGCSLKIMCYHSSTSLLKGISAPHQRCTKPFQLPQSSQSEELWGGLSFHFCLPREALVPL